MLVATHAYVVDQVLLCDPCAGLRIPGLHSDYNENEAPEVIIHLPIYQFECSGCGVTVQRPGIGTRHG